MLDWLYSFYVVAIVCIAGYAFYLINAIKKLKNFKYSVYDLVFQAIIVVFVLMFALVVSLETLNPDIPLIIPVTDNPPSLWLMIIDQALKGALFDALEVYDISVTPFKPNPEVWWFAAIFVVFRFAVSFFVVGAIMNMTSNRWRLVKARFGW